MTISISTARAADLAAHELQHNPLIVWEQLAASAATGVGTQVETAANALDPATYNFWAATPNVSDAAALDLTLAAGAAVNFVGLAAHNLADIGATVTLQYSTDGGSSWTDSAAPAVTPADNRAIGFRFAVSTAADWRLAISDAADDAVIGVALAGREIVIERRLYQGYAPPLTPNRVELLSNISEGGHFLGNSAMRTGSQVTASLSHVTPSQIRSAAWLAFQQAFNAGTPFFWAWRPGKYGDLFYAQRQAGGGALAPVNSGPRDLMSFDLPMRLFHDEAMT